MTSVLVLIGFVVAWPIVMLILTYIVNTIRVKMGMKINDPLSVFMMAMILPPAALLGSMSIEARVARKTRPMFWGGAFGLALAIYVYFRWM